MIASLLFAMQVAATATTVTVRDGARTATIPVVQTRTGTLVRAGDLLPPLGGRITRRPPDQFIVDVGDARIEFTLGLPFARIAGAAAPIAAGPLVRDEEVYLPITLLTDLLPRYATGFAWDSAAGAVVRTRAVVESDGTLAEPVRSPPANGAGRSTPAPKANPRRPLVVVDAGHGGRDRGMTGTLSSSAKVYEKDITLAVAKALRSALQERGIDVLLTRSTDTLIALRDRGRIANDNGASLFLSIHVNAANPRWKNPRSARGFETYFLSDAKTEDERRVAEMENEADQFLDIDAKPGDPLSFLLNDMLQNEYLRESSALAAAMQSGLKSVHPSKADRGVKQAGFAVLIAAHMPAALVEIGFGTNPSDASWMKSAKGQKQLADAIATATEHYLADYARRGGATLGGR